MAVRYEEGNYKSRILKWALATNNKGNPQFVVEHKPFVKLIDIDGDVEEAPLRDEDQAHRTIFLVITENTIKMVRDKLLRLGYNRKSLQDLDIDSPTAFDFHGMEFVASCRLEVYEGKEKEKWDVQRKKAYTPMTADQVKGLLDKYDTDFAGGEEDSESAEEYFKKLQEENTAA